MQGRSRVFVSYSHADQEHLARLKVHLRPFERKSLVDVWSDTKISVGQLWRKEIQEAIDNAAAAILLVSADFLASDFIAENELPPLLARAQSEGMKILPVVVKPCAFSDVQEISRFQSVNDPRQPLIALDEAGKEQLWCEVAVAARDAILPTKYAIARQTIEAAARHEYWDTGIELFGEEIQDHSVVDQYIVYQYQYIDTLDYMRDAKEVFAAYPGREQLFERVKKRLLQGGWEGDGILQILWLPPFLGAGIEDTFGVGVWFVKQGSKGTAWLASPVPLPFERLEEQNEFL
jgi:hypothetical protein